MTGPGQHRLGLAAVALLAAVAGIAYLSRYGEAPIPTAGLVHATEVRIAPEIGGRLGKRLRQAGERVSAGDPVAVLDVPELVAAVAEAEAAVAEARADRNRVYAGVREEQVAILAREIEKAQATLKRAAASARLTRRRALPT